MELKPTVRAEFVIPGALALATFAWLFGAVSHLWHADPLSSLVAHKPATLTGSASAVIGALLLVAVAYCVGIMVVMLTYDIVAKRMRESLRAVQKQALSATVEPIPLRAPLSRDGRAATLHGFFFDTVPDPARAEVSRVVDAIALDAMSQYALKEHEYRRSLRQLSAGIVPSLGATAAVGVLTDWTDWGLSDVLAPAVRAAVIVVTLAAYRALHRTVVFQEIRRQQLLLHTAWLQLLSACAKPPRPVPVTVRTHAR